MHAQPLYICMEMGFDKIIGRENMCESFDRALNRAREILGLPTEAPPVGTVPEVARDATVVDDADDSAAGFKVV